MILLNIVIKSWHNGNKVINKFFLKCTSNTLILKSTLPEYQFLSRTLFKGLCATKPFLWSFHQRLAKTNVQDDNNNGLSEHSSLPFGSARNHLRWQVLTANIKDWKAKIWMLHIILPDKDFSREGKCLPFLAQTHECTRLYLQTKVEWS